MLGIEKPVLRKSVNSVLFTCKPALFIFVTYPYVLECCSQLPLNFHMGTEWASLKVEVKHEKGIPSPPDLPKTL